MNWVLGSGLACWSEVEFWSFANTAVLLSFPYLRFVDWWYQLVFLSHLPPVCVLEVVTDDLIKGNE
jgi:hypothetical protein